MLVSTLLGLAGLGALSWLLFALAVHALPFFAGLWGALLAHDLGSGAISAFLVGLAAGTGTLALGQVLAAADRADAEQQWREAVAARGLVNAEFRPQALGSGWRWTNIRVAPVLDASGTIEK